MQEGVGFGSIVLNWREGHMELFVHFLGFKGRHFIKSGIVEDDRVPAGRLEGIGGERLHLTFDLENRVLLLN